MMLLTFVHTSIANANYHILASFKVGVKKFPEDGSVVPKYVGEIKYCIVVYVVCAFSLLSKRR
jgi:hypothetical protein